MEDRISRHAFLCSLSPDSDQHRHLLNFNAQQWTEFLNWGDHHRILPVLSHTLSSIECPQDIREHLREAGAEATAHNLALKGLEKSTLRSLRDSGIECLPFKGPNLAEYLYGSASTRACYDIDILIHPDDHEKAADVLCKLSFERDVPDIPSQLWHAYRYEESYTQTDKGLFLELHWRFMPTFIPFRFTVEDALRYCDSAAHPPGCSHLPPHILFALLAAHGYRHYWRQLCWLTDIIRLISMDTINWSELAQFAKDVKIERIIRLALTLAETIPGVSIPNLDLPALPKRSAPFIDSVINSWLSMPLEEPESDYSFIRQFLDTFYQRQLCLKRLTFQPTLADFKFITLPSGLTWLYPGIRIVRLMTRN